MCISQRPENVSSPKSNSEKLLPAHSIKLVFPYVAKAIKIKITAKFRDMEHLRFEDTKRIMSPEKRPKSFGTFEKQAPEGKYHRVSANNHSLTYESLRSQI